MTKKIKLILLSLILSFISLSAQVTIGSGIDPNPGMLLDLKQNNNLGSNSDKGFMLPRVNLTNLSNLYPMFLDDTDYTINKDGKKTTEDNLHIGLVVYNMNQCISPTGKGKGVYTWVGNKWMMVNELPASPLSSSTNQYTDQDGQSFYARVFGAAGEWMTQNLRVKRYADDLAPLPAVMVPDSDGKKWGYPGSTGAGSTSSVLYDSQNNIGYVYNINAIMRSATVTSAADQGAGGGAPLAEGGLGLCPQGWHLPSDIEWNVLEQEISQAPAMYSSLASASAWDPTWNQASGANTLRGTHGEAMKAICLPPPFLQSAGGKSFSTEGGGFNAILLQDPSAADLHSAVYWTASKYTGTNKAWLRYLSQDVANDLAKNKTVVRMTNLSGANDMYAIRCKKTTAFARCGDPLIDSDGNTYQTASYGTAGCWVTSNIRSTKNSQITLTQGANASDADQAVYVAPNNGTGAVDADGYLYTWKAATAGGTGFEMLMSAEAGADKSTVQGICPDGWVLPSDYDWSLLETEMNNNPVKYSTLATSSVTWSTAFASANGWRPTPADKSKGWGQSFKSKVVINGVAQTQPALSLPSGNGFNTRLVGGMQSGAAQSFGSVSNVWTSSAVFTPLGMDEAAKYRGFMFDNSGVYRDNASKTNMLNVRCKLKQ